MVNNIRCLEKGEVDGERERSRRGEADRETCLQREGGREGRRESERESARAREREREMGGVGTHREREAWVHRDLHERGLFRYIHPTHSDLHTGVLQAALPPPPPPHTTYTTYTHTHTHMNISALRARSVKVPLRFFFKKNLRYGNHVAPHRRFWLSHKRLINVS